MGRIEEDKNMQSDIEKRLSEIVKTEIDKLTKAQEFGTEMSFSECAPYFSKSIDIFRQVSTLIASENVPRGFLEIINSALNDTQSVFNRFTQFSLTQPSAQGRNIPAERTDMIRAGIDVSERNFMQLHPIISFYSAKKLNQSKVNEQAEMILKQMRDELDLVTKIRNDASNTLSAVQRIAQESGVSQHAGVFATEATLHIKFARYWLIATAIMTLVTVCVCWYFFHLVFESEPIAVDGSKIPMSSAQMVQLAIAKVALLSVLFTATIWIGRLYRAHRHNAIVNKHRSNALRTFETFVGSTKDESTKNTVLIKATECIFSPQQTGYSSHDTETGGAAQIVEIVRGMTSGGK